MVTFDTDGLTVSQPCIVEHIEFYHSPGDEAFHGPLYPHVENSGAYVNEGECYDV